MRRMKRPGEANTEVTTEASGSTEQTSEQVLKEELSVSKPISDNAPSEPVRTPKIEAPVGEREKRGVPSPTETVSVTWGEELFSPVQYNSCRIGPFSLTVGVREGETQQQALQRAGEDLAAYVTKVRSAKIRSFREELVACGVIRL